MSHWRQEEHKKSLVKESLTTKKKLFCWLICIAKKKKKNVRKSSLNLILSFKIFLLLFLFCIISQTNFIITTDSRFVIILWFLFKYKFPSLKENRKKTIAWLKESSIVITVTYRFSAYCIVSKWKHQTNNIYIVFRDVPWLYFYYLKKKRLLLGNKWAIYIFLR